jgi:hypothetical protein
MTDGALAFSRYASSAYTERMRIESSGNVKLTSPVNSNGYTEMLRLEGQTLANGWERGIAFTGNSGGLEVGRISSYLTGTERHLRFTSAGALGMTIRETGNVGIGTSSPISPLQVLGTGTLGYATSNAISSGMSAISNAAAFNNIGSAKLTANFGGAVDFTGRSSELVFAADNGNFGGGGGFPQGLLGAITASSVNGNASTLASNLIFYNTAGNSLTERMRITSAGNVGINDSSPDTKLHVSHNVAGTPLATFENTASHEASIRFKSTHSSDSDFRIGASISASNNFEIYSVGAAAARLKINSTGDFFVQRVYDNTTGGSANVLVASNGQFLRSTSSQRYKNTINDATHGLTELLTLRPVTYKGNNDGDTVFGGLIAEEVHDAGLTEFVHYNDDGEPDALAYGNMVSLCIKAIQELEARITALESN